MTVTSVDIDKLKQLKKKAAEQETTIKKLVNQAVNEYYDFE